MINLPLVSIVMPVYNGEATLRYALSSLLLQSYKNWKCIIVNDGSTDATKSIIDSIEDPRFVAYHLDKNVGRGVARDYALQFVQGDYLAYLDADDMLHEDKLKFQVEYMNAHPSVSMISCASITFSENLDPIKVSSLEYLERDGYRYGDSLPLVLPSVMVRLPKAKQISYDHFLDVGEDYDYFSRYCDGGKYVYLPIPLYYYRTGNNSIRKILYYQSNSMRVSLSLIRNGRLIKGVYDLLLRFIKLIIYLFILPIFGAERVVNTRGNSIKLADSQVVTYMQQIEKIQHSNNILIEAYNDLV